ncbi:MAG: hypothetical protein ABGY43_19130 [bacterium]|nr:hypothetical protein [Gammaproteobacteria bacterium]
MYSSKITLYNPYSLMQGKQVMMLVGKLSEPKMLWSSFAVTLLLTIAFQVIVRQLDLVLLDAIANPNEVRSAIAGMSEYHRSFHAWMTVTLDVAYPLAYGSLFVGSAYRFFPSWGRLLSVPAIACVGIDLIEGIVQVLALVGNVDLIDLKAILTPLKLTLFGSGFLITITGWTRWSIRRVRVAK